MPGNQAKTTHLKLRTRLRQEFPVVNSDGPLEAVQGGIINHTWRLGGERDHIVQLTPVTTPIEADERLEAMQSGFADIGIAIPMPCRSRGGLLSVDYAPGVRLRVRRAIPGTHAATPLDEASIHDLGMLLGRMDCVLRDQSGWQRWPKVEHRDTGVVMRRLASVALSSSDKDVGRLSLAVLRASDGQWSAVRMRSTDAPCHGDPRLANILFDHETGRPCGVIDFDTLGRAPQLEELGDALRSILGARDAGSDPKPAAAAFVRGLSDGRAADSNATSAELLRAAIAVQITLAARFCLAAERREPFTWGASDDVAHRARAVREGCHRLRQAQGWLRWL